MTRTMNDDQDPALETPPPHDATKHTEYEGEHDDKVGTQKEMQKRGRDEETQDEKQAAGKSSNWENTKRKQRSKEEARDAEDLGKTTMKGSSKEVEEYEEEGGGICDEDNNNRVRKKT